MVSSHVYSNLTFTISAQRHHQINLYELYMMAKLKMIIFTHSYISQKTITIDGMMPSL